VGRAASAFASIRHTVPVDQAACAAEAALLANDPF